jgi:hypothetical protein
MAEGADLLLNSILINPQVVLFQRAGDLVRFLIDYLHIYQYQVHIGVKSAFLLI